FAPSRWRIGTSRLPSSIPCLPTKEGNRMISTDTLLLSVVELAKLIKSKQLSPVELTEAYLERARSTGARLNAYATLTPDLALQQARAAEAEIKAGNYRGPLHGIPYAAKDLL